MADSRVTPAGNQVPNTPAPSAFANGVAGGWIGYKEKVSDTTGIVASEVPIISLTVTVNSSRLILLTGYYPSWISTVNSDRAQMRLLEGGTQLQLARSMTQLAGTATEQPTILQRVLTAPSAGSHTYSMTMVRNTGTGSLTLSGDPTGPAFLLVQDIGPWT